VLERLAKYSLSVLYALTKAKIGLTKELELLVPGVGTDLIARD